MTSKLKYSKAIGFYLDTKKDFFTGNEALLKKARKINKLYGQQDVRTECKICLSKLIKPFFKESVSSFLRFSFSTPPCIFNAVSYTHLTLPTKA